MCCKGRGAAAVRVAIGAMGVAVMVSAGAARAQGVRAEPVATGLSQPLYVCAPPPPGVGQPADDRLFIVQQGGVIRILHLSDNSLEPTPFMDVSAQITSGGERGLLGMAFHPNFRDPNNRYFFVNYTNLDGNSEVVRFQVSASDPNVADPASAVIIKTYTQDFANHNAGCLQFGPDGYLYDSTGDGGSGNDPNEHAQATDTLLGKMLRLDVDNPSNGYIPPDNPYVGVDGMDEIWAIGLRNPWRFSFDRLTGDLYIGDVGQSQREEVDFQPANALGSLPGQPGYQGGRNYGWRCREGTRCTGLANCVCPDPSYVDPVFEYTHSDPNIDPATGGVQAIMGGYVYRGQAMPYLRGFYFWADVGSTSSWFGAFRMDNGAAVNVLDMTPSITSQTGPIPRVVSFGEDADGELYFTSIAAGTVYKLVPDEATCGCPCALSGCNTTLFQDDFETDKGWATQIDGATAGQWQRGVPINDPNWQYDPIADSDGSGSCWLTENDNNPAYTDPSNTDVDNGSVLLISPRIDMTAGAITICYDYFLNLDGDSTGDSLLVEISSDDGAATWTPIAEHTTDGELGWRHVAITQADLDAAGVTLTDTMRLRFTATDADPQTIVEAGVDAVAVWTANPPFADCNGNCVDDAVDIASGTSRDANANGVPDECEPCLCELDGNGTVDVFDLLDYLGLWFDHAAAAELTGDDPANVDVFDLLAYLSCWFDATGGQGC